MSKNLFGDRQSAPGSGRLDAISITEIYQYASGGLSATTHRYGKYYVVRCPASDHEDVHPSCLLKPDPGVWRCLACGRKGGKLSLVTAAGYATDNASAMRWIEKSFAHSLPLRPQPMMKHEQTKDARGQKLKNERHVATHRYTDKDGTVLYEILRYEGDDTGDEMRPKRFELRRPDGAGRWISHYAGSCDKPACPCHKGGPLATVKLQLVPYRLPELIAGCLAKRAVITVEGEQKADALAKLGFVATCNTFGWGFEYPAEWLRWFDGTPLTYNLADADKEGRKSAQRRSDFLRSPKREAYSVDLYPERNDGSDIINWLREHPGTPQEQRVAVEQTLRSHLLPKSDSP